MKPTIRIHDAETNEIIDREMTDLEYAEYEANKTKVEAENKNAQVIADKKSALLDRLGITEDEARLLIS